MKTDDTKELVKKLKEDMKKFVSSKPWREECSEEDWDEFLEKFHDTLSDIPVPSCVKEKPALETTHDAIKILKPICPPSLRGLNPNDFRSLMFAIKSGNPGGYNSAYFQFLSNKSWLVKTSEKPVSFISTEKDGIFVADKLGLVSVFMGCGRCLTKDLVKKLDDESYSVPDHKYTVMISGLLSPRQALEAWIYLLAVEGLSDLFDNHLFIDSRRELVEYLDQEQSS